ncbi:hypothetical protein QEN19_002091 [Hanseniaspora menglaensis]
MSSDRYNSNGSNNNKKSYRSYNTGRYNDNGGNYQDRHQNLNTYGSNESRFVNNDTYTGRPYSNTSGSSQSDRFNNTYKKSYGNKNAYNTYNKNTFYNNNSSTKTNEHYQNRYEGNKGYDFTEKYQNNSYSQNYREEYNTKPKSSFSAPIKQVDVIDTLITETMQKSIYIDIFERYLNIYKKMIIDGSLKEKEVIEKFEQLKASIFFEELNETTKKATGTNGKHPSSIAEKEKHKKKSQISKLSYNIAMMHYKNIDDVLGYESKTLEDLSLL